MGKKAKIKAKIVDAKIVDESEDTMRSASTGARKFDDFYCFYIVSFLINFAFFLAVPLKLLNYLIFLYWRAFQVLG